MAKDAPMSARDAAGGAPSRAVGPWRVHDRRCVFANPWIEIHDHAVTQPDGTPGQYGVVHFCNRAIGVLAVDAAGHVPIVGQHRFALDRYSWELPEGGAQLSEDPLDGARRELKEETGYEAAHWLEFAQFDTSNSVTDEAAVCFLAWDLTAGAPDPDPTEVLTSEAVPFATLHERVLGGLIRDSLTIVMVLKAAALARAGKLPHEIARHLAV